MVTHTASNSKVDSECSWTLEVPIHIFSINMDLKYVKLSTFIVRITGLAYFFTVIWNLEWIVTNLNLDSYWSSFFSLLFLLAIVLTTVSGIILVINNWNFSMIKPCLLNAKEKPKVAILIPTYNEPIEIVLNTLKSVVDQEWPKNKRIIIISDDGYNENLKKAIEKFKYENQERGVIYHTPHKKGHPERLGDAKAGNLNSALHLIIKKFPNIEYIETRDADDLVESKHFLSYCLNTLVNDPELSFVQTIKQCHVGNGDPFCNQEAIFYQRVMPSRHSANAVFPCGSGLVWRLSHLKKIQGFPSWNLVEDLQSGFEILRIGGRGAFLPIVGALGQIAPEDIPNFYKQRGTWALDTLRLFYYKNPLFTKGLSMMQRLQFFELEFSYLLSFAMCVFIFTISVSLSTGVYPILSSPEDYLIHAILFALILEIYNIARARGISYSEQWRARQIWLGLMPVFMVAAFQALKYGSKRKPEYNVTKKFHTFAWYWKETLIQKFVIAILSTSIVISLFFRNDNPIEALPLIFWALFFIYGFSQVVKNSWHGVNFRITEPKMKK